MKQSYISKEKKILEEIKKVLEKNSESSEKDIVKEIKKAKKIFVFGQGRSGLMAKSFAMRLAQMGKKTFVVGETITPSIGNKDLLLVVSGSGETKTVIDIVKEAKSVNAKIFCITSNNKSTIAKQSDKIIILNAKTKVCGKSIEPLGSLFEQSTLIFLDAVILGLMGKNTETKMKKRHATLE
jgi:6-phospho-3-hexuloisomerase